MSSRRGACGEFAELPGLRRNPEKNTKSVWVKLARALAPAQPELAGPSLRRQLGGNHAWAKKAGGECSDLVIDHSRS